MSPKGTAGGAPEVRASSGIQSPHGAFQSIAVVTPDLSGPRGRGHAPSSCRQNLGTWPQRALVTVLLSRVTGPAHASRAPGQDAATSLGWMGPQENRPERPRLRAGGSRSDWSPLSGPFQPAGKQFLNKVTGRASGRLLFPTQLRAQARAPLTHVGFFLLGQKSRPSGPLSLTGLHPEIRHKGLEQ